MLNRTPRTAWLALLLLVPAASLGTLAGLSWGAGTWRGRGIYAICKIWMLVLPLIWLVRVEHEPIRLPRFSGRGVAVGGLLGLLVAGVIIGAYIVVSMWGWIDIAVMRAAMSRNQLTNPAYYLAFVTGLTLVNALLEEYLWRWFVVRRWEEALAPVARPGSRASGAAAAILSAACFTIHHVAAMSIYFDWRTNALASTGVFLGGVIWSTLYVRYRSIWPGYVCHVLADAAIFAVGYHILFR